MRLESQDASLNLLFLQIMKKVNQVKWLLAFVFAIYLPHATAELEARPFSPSVVLVLNPTQVDLLGAASIVADSPQGRPRQASRVLVVDDSITTRTLERHILESNGYTVKIATDDEKAYDRGSDVERLAGTGIEVRVDEPDHHMHHKFAVFDDARLVTGSYNWTRSAAERNQENVLVSDDTRLVRPYREMFDRLWGRLRPIHER